MAATRARYYVLSLTFVTAFLTYVARVSIGAAKPAIMEQLGLGKVAMAWSTSAFNWGYALFQVPGGWMADRFGPRIVLGASLAAFSFFKFASGLAFSAATLAVARFFVGVGQAVSWPTTSRSLVRWMPLHRRALGQGAQRAGARFGAAVTPPLVVFLMVSMSWQHAFHLFGLAGLLWAVFWYYYYRDYPEEHPGVNPQELEILRAHGSTARPAGKPIVPWRQILRSRSLWYLCAMYFCYGWVLWMYLSWLPTYLVEARGFSSTQMGLAASAPLLAASVSNMLGGWLSDRLARRLHDLRRGRLLVSLLGFAIAGTALIPGVLAKGASTGLIFLTLALAGLELTVAVSWAMCIDLGGDSSGSVSAVMNTFGNISPALSEVVVGYLAVHFGWNWPFLLASGMCLAAALLATQIDPGRKIC
jgi:sugar phosphate permease